MQPGKAEWPIIEITLLGSNLLDSFVARFGMCRAVIGEGYPKVGNTMGIYSCWNLLDASLPLGIKPTSLVLKKYARTLLEVFNVLPYMSEEGITLEGTAES